MSKYPLDGVRIIALEQYIAAPYCTMWLADCGAEVIKIERPDGGDPRRNYQPSLKSGSGESVYGGFVTYNRNKKSIALDLQTPEGRQVYLDLIKSADVVVENLKPGSVEKLGLGYADLIKINPKLIYAAISGYGRTKDLDGVYSGLPAFDPVIQAMSGITNLFGEEAAVLLEVSPLALGDLFTGVMAGYQILLALFMRERTGAGQYIDAAMYDSLVALNGEEPDALHLRRRGSQPRPRQIPGALPHLCRQRRLCGADHPERLHLGALLQGARQGRVGGSSADGGRSSARGQHPMPGSLLSSNGWPSAAPMT